MPKEKLNKTNINLEVQNKLKDFRQKLINNAGTIQTTDTKPLFKEYGPPVSPKVFIESTEYFGNSTTKLIRPWLIDCMEEIFSNEYYAPKYQTVVIMAGKGSGKSYLSSLAACYMWYWLLSFNSFGEYLKTKNCQYDEDTILGIVGMAKSRDQVKKIFFDVTGKFLNRTSAFRERLWLPDKKITSEFVYKEKDQITGKENTKLAIIPGNSSENFALGYNIWAAVIDEVEFFAEKTNDPVEGIYSELNNRRNSRFKNNGMIMMISSARVDGTFMTSFEGKAENDPTILFKRKSTYDCDPTYFGKPTFEFKTKHEKGNGEIVNITLHPPLEFKAYYDLDPHTALRDYDALPSVAGKPFFSDYMLLNSRFNSDRVDPAPDKGQNIPEGPNDLAAILKENPNFRGARGAKYRVHADLSKGDMINGQCGCGFAMVHKVVDAKLGFRIYVDLSVRFKAPPSKEVQINEVVELIKFLKDELEFDIDMATFDEYNSLMPIQTINGWNNGTFAVKQSVDYKVYCLFKNLIYSGQLDIFEDSNLLFELKRLEDYGTLIDHAPGAFKDEADACAGAAFSATMLNPVEEEPEDKVPDRVKVGRVVPRGFTPPMPGPRSSGGLTAKYRQDYIPRYR